MLAERWKKIEELYQAALAEPAEKRGEVLRRACPADPGLCAEVESLLEAACNAISFLEGSPISGTEESDAPSEAMDSGEAAGTVIGRYRLLQKIGEGGMGEVWLAEQKEPVRRRVALKLVKAGMNSREVITRFESERQALALMDHPAIAKVLDAGYAPQGRPYFVMEYVAGIPITSYCDKHKLATRERLELFIRVCEGVQHAHQKGNHSPRPEAIQHSGHRSGRKACAEDHRLRSCQGTDPEAHCGNDVHPCGSNDWDSGIHEPGAGAFVGRGHRYANGCLLAGDRRSEEHTSEFQSPVHLVCRLLL